MSFKKPRQPQHPTNRRPAESNVEVGGHSSLRGKDYASQKNQLSPGAQTKTAFMAPIFIDPTFHKDPHAAVIERLGGAIQKQAATHGVPVQVIQGVLYYEQRDRSALGDVWGKFWQKPTVSLGLAQIQVQRAAELDGRNINENPLDTDEFDELATQLENEEKNIEYLARELADNFKYYGKIPGKTDSDRWRFAVAKHKSGHGPVGEAQVTADKNGKNKNVWADVAPYLGAEIQTFVDNVFTYVQLTPSGTSGSHLA